MTGQVDASDVPTAERMADLARAKTSAIKHKMQGDQRAQHGAAYGADRADVEALLKEWPAAPAKIARKMLEQYGPPNEATPVRLIWYANGPWKRTEVTRDEIVHNFPTSHTDFLTQWIDYPCRPSGSQTSRGSTAAAWRTGRPARRRPAVTARR